MISASKADCEAPAASSLLEVPKNKKCMEVLTSESDNDSDYDDNGAAEAPCLAAPLSS